MKKNILLFLMPFLFVIAADAQAQEWYDEGSCCYENCCCETTNFYAKVFGGANFLQNTTISDNRTQYNTGYVISGALGYSWFYGLHLEAEYAYRLNTISKIHFFGEGCSKHGHFQTSSYMANLLWDLPLSLCGCTCWDIRPFVGAGIGGDCQQMHSSNSRIVFHQKWHHFSWQAIAGLSYPVFCNTELTVEYRFHQGGCHFNNHSVGIGLVYNFGFW